MRKKASQNSLGADGQDQDDQDEWLEEDGDLIYQEEMDDPEEMFQFEAREENCQSEEEDDEAQIKDSIFSDSKQHQLLQSKSPQKIASISPKAKKAQ